jgi:hypothetical protein
MRQDRVLGKKKLRRKIRRLLKYVAKGENLYLG